MEPIATVGAAFALAFARYFAANPLPRPRLPPPPSASGSDHSGKDGEICTVSRTGNFGGISNGLRVLQSEDAFAKVIHGASAAAIRTAPSISSNSEDEEPNQAAVTEDDATKEDRKTDLMVRASDEKPNSKDLEMEQEIMRLRNLVESLSQRQRELEMEMLENYGLKEREAATKELENRLKISSVEAKFLTLKVESLQDENQRLKNQILEFEGLKNKLESMKAKIKLLKKQLKLDGEEARARMAELKNRIDVLAEKENKDEEEKTELESKLARLTQLDEEAAKLRKMNSRLEEENLELARKLESFKIPEEDILEEAIRLREANENLSKEIERLRSNQCRDIEELVYLRWINACLRYELRNFQPPPGKISARDLNKIPSHRSEEKAKQLILEYSNSACNIDTCSSSQESPCGFTTAKRSSGSEKPPKLYSKLKKLVCGTSRSSGRKIASAGQSPTMWSSSERAEASPTSFTVDDEFTRKSFDSLSSCLSPEQVRDQLRRPQNHSRSRSDVVFSYDGKNTEFAEGSPVFYPNRRGSEMDPGEFDAVEEVVLKRFAEALSSSNASPEL
ncbi:Protein CHUP1, chloroplastic [Ananas comosus]|uniref:Protein CHUP1, chloroplastic n=1 Tax=Ananas comosus TaxID=4615 RepID=A0A199V4S3_ANACO|nr:Protein CHUP1, chloroplastic [Ananas comosus]